MEILLIFCCCKNCIPLLSWKKTLRLSQQPPSKNWDPINPPPFFGNLVGGQLPPPPPPPSIKGVGYTLWMYWGLTRNVVFCWCSDLISHKKHTQTQTHKDTQHTQDPVDWHTNINIHLHQLLCAHSSCLLLSTMSFFFKNIHLLKPYMLKYPPLLFYQPLPFYGKNRNPPFFYENWTPNLTKVSAHSFTDKQVIIIIQFQKILFHWGLQLY